MADDIGFSRLPRGAKILWERVAYSRTLSLGFFFATGSRYDPPGKAGTAHLSEHLVFKGTKNHSAASLARLVDRVGGDLNAWTDREEMAFTCSVPAEAWSVAVEALTELCLFPTFPPDEFEREKEVIRNEILASLEDPEELSVECFLQGVSPGDWSRAIAGSEASLAGITLKEVERWWRQFGDPSRLTVVLSGGIDPQLVEQVIAERVSGWERLSESKAPRIDSTPPKFQPGSKRWIEKVDFQMVQIIGGFSFPAPLSAREATLWQIFSTLWGETMSSRLFQTVREKRGLCYSISSQVFDAQGTWSLQYFANCAPENTQRLLQALDDEVLRLADDPPTESEWDDGRMALKGGLILGSERMENRISRLWRYFESFGLLWGTEEAASQVSRSVGVEERRAVVSVLVQQRPNLLVWGRVPRRLVLSSGKR